MYFIIQLKGRIKEDEDFERLIERAIQYNTPYSDYMTIIPTLNQEKGKIFVDEAKYWMGESKTMAIDEEN